MNITSYYDEESYLGTSVLSESDHGILTCEENVVRWINRQGNKVVKQFSCTTRPLSAVFMQNNYENDFQGGPSVAILVSQSLVRIFTFSGQMFETVLSFFARKLHSTSFGIVVERNMSIGSQLLSNHEDCMLYVLSSPVEQLRPVIGCDVDMLCGGGSNSVTVWGRIVVFRDSKSEMVHLLTLQEAGGESVMLGASFMSDANSADSFADFPPSHAIPHNTLSALGLDDTAGGLAASDEGTHAGSPDPGRWRYSKKGRVSSLGKSKQAKQVSRVHTTRQQDLASALGVSGISGDGRSVSPYRGEIDPAHAHHMLERSGSGGSAAMSSVLTDTTMSVSIAHPNESCADMQNATLFGNDMWSSTLNDFTTPFTLKPYGHVSVPACTERDDADCEISFSLAPRGGLLLHILSKQNQTLNTYECTTPTVSGASLPLVGGSTSSNITAVRSLSDVQCVTHMALGRLPFGTISESNDQNLLYATLVVNAKVW
jgi:hypothetical protein